jgi:hypothetical protein
VVLRLETGGGLVPFGVLATQLPTFSLYADGSVIFGPLTDLNGTGLPPLRYARLSHERMAALVDDAMKDGGLASARGHYVVPGVSDAPLTVFTLDVEGITKRVSVSGLGLGSVEDGDDARVLRALERLASRLAGFESEATGEGVTSLGPYQPVGYRGVLTEADPALSGAIRWPWDDLLPGDFRPWDDRPAVRVAALSPGQVALITEEPSGGHLGILITGPDGASYTLAIRPLLPDEALVPREPERADGR